MFIIDIHREFEIMEIEIFQNIFIGLRSRKLSSLPDNTFGLRFQAYSWISDRGHELTHFQVYEIKFISRKNCAKSASASSEVIIVRKSVKRGGLGLDIDRSVPTLRSYVPRPASDAGRGSRGLCCAYISKAGGSAHVTRVR